MSGTQGCYERKPLERQIVALWPVKRSRELLQEVFDRLPAWKTKTTSETLHRPKLCSELEVSNLLD